MLNISLITIVRNGMPFIQETYESILKLTTHNIEWVVQDSESTDGTLEFLRSIDPPFEFALVSEKDDSINDGWNRAIRRAKYDIIASIDADNTILPKALEIASLYFEADPELAALYGSQDLIGPNGESRGEFHPGPFDLTALLQNRLVPPWNSAVFRKSLCSDGLLCALDIEWCPDFDMWLRMSHLKILRIKEKLAITRLSNASLSCNWDSYPKFVKSKHRALDKYFRGTSPHPVLQEQKRLGKLGVLSWASEQLMGMPDIPFSEQTKLVGDFLAQAGKLGRLNERIFAVSDAFHGARGQLPTQCPFHSISTQETIQHDHFQFQPYYRITELNDRLTRVQPELEQISNHPIKMAMPMTPWSYGWIIHVPPWKDKADYLFCRIQGTCTESLEVSWLAPNGTDVIRRIHWRENVQAPHLDLYLTPEDDAQFLVFRAVDHGKPSEVQLNFIEFSLVHEKI